MADSGTNPPPCFRVAASLELSEKAKQDLREFEEQERQKRQNRHGGRGGRGARGGRGRGFHPYGMADFRGGHRGKMNDHRPPLMGHMGKLVRFHTLREPPDFSTKC